MAMTRNGGGYGDGGRVGIIEVVGIAWMGLVMKAGFCVCLEFSWEGDLGWGDEGVREGTENKNR